MRARLVTFVEGVPRPKGSMKEQGRGHLVQSVKGSSAWGQAVAVAVRKVWTAEPILGPVSVSLQFWFVAADWPGTYRMDPRPTGQSVGDLDKLERNVLDALTRAGVWKDDRQVVEMQSSKLWTQPLMKGGVLILVEPFEGFGRAADEYLPAAQ